MNKEILKSKIKIFSGNEVYRYGDVNAIKVNNSLTDDFFKNTILLKYKKQKNIMKDSKSIILKNIVENHIKQYRFKSPPDDALVIHIRAGDDYKGRGIGNMNRYQSLTKQIRLALNLNKNIKKLIIVTAFHYGISTTSVAYSNSNYRFSNESLEKNIEILLQFIKQFNYPTEIVSNDNIDYDFCYLCYAKNLITSGGAFSDLAKKINDLKPLKPKLSSTENLEMPDTIIKNAVLKDNSQNNTTSAIKKTKQTKTKTNNTQTLNKRQIKENNNTSVASKRPIKKNNTTMVVNKASN
tara:strand:+ start:509 stop:1393 length:885 start_codon:yes stop_codon:yes gene_type:complete